MASKDTVAYDKRVTAALAKMNEALEELRRLNYQPGENDELVSSCSFCGRANTEVEHLIAGGGVIICDTCIERCADLLAELRSENEKAN